MPRKQQSPMGSVARLLGVPGAAFLRDYFGKKPLVARGRGAVLPELYSWDGSAQPEELHAFYYRNGATGSSAIPVELRSFVQAAGLTTNGRVSTSAFRMFADSLCADIGYPYGASTRLIESADDHGFPPHFDVYHVFVLQLKGAKRWEVESAPQEMWPEKGRVFPNGNGAQSRVRRLTLRTGDALYVPPGTWHVARAQEVSVAVSIVLPDYRVRDLLSDVVFEPLKGLPQWRQHLPPMGDGGDLGRNVTEYRELAQARIEELRRRLLALKVEDVCDAWIRRVMASGPERRLVKRVRVARVDDLEHCGPGALRVLDIVGNVSVVTPGGSLRLGRELLPLASWLSRHPRFRANDARRAAGEEYAWPPVRKLLQELVCLRALRVVGS